MIGAVIETCVRHRVLVLLLAACLVGAGLWSIRRLPVDAIPDLSDVQVIIRAEYPGQAPDIVEAQVTYPLTTAMLAVPRTSAVRGYSMFGVAFVYIIFEDGTDQYWARSRVLEQLSVAAARLPRNVTPQLGPDATGVGWVFEYVLLTGPFCPRHPRGLWLDLESGAWYESCEAAPPERRDRLSLHRIFPAAERCPLDGSPLADPDLDLADLRALQDWHLRYELTTCEGVSEVAAVGGFVRQYQVVVDPARLLALNLSLSDVRRAIERSNADIGGRALELSETEFMIRVRGYLGGVDDGAPGARPDDARRRAARVMADLGTIALGPPRDGRVVRLRDVAEIRMGPDMRRGIAEWNGEGETVGGIVVMRAGGNARQTIAAVRARLDELTPNLPPGVALAVAYDRSDLIARATRTLTHALAQEMAVVALACLVFLLHARSGLVAICVLPAGVLTALAMMRLLDINANIMSLGGIAIAIGVMVDSSIVMVENAHKHLEREAQGGSAQPARSHAQIVLDAAREVGPSLFFSLLIITVSFLPVFALGEHSGRLIRPLALTKTLAMTAAAVLAVTVIPPLSVYLVRSRVLPDTWGRLPTAAFVLAVILLPAAGLLALPGRVLPGAWPQALAAAWVVLAAMVLLPQRLVPEERNPVSRLLQRMYDPFFALAMRFRYLVILLAAGLMAATLYPLTRLGSEFMPPLEEGDLLYMPTTDPGLSPTKAREILQQTDRLIRQFPEVASVFGKIGRAESATDPAPLEMIETTIMLHRDPARWRSVPVRRFFSDWPRFLRRPLAFLWPEQRRISLDELIYGYTGPDGQHVPGLNDVVRIPGLTNSWTMPIRTRIDMLSTGIRTPVGVKITGPDLAVLADLAQRIAQTLRTAEGVGPYTTSAFAERTTGGRYLDITIDREQIARLGLHVADVQEAVAAAVGSAEGTWTVEGRERYSVALRYPHERRDTPAALRDVLISTPGGVQIPLGQVATFAFRDGPAMIRSENARPSAWVYVDMTGLDVGTYVARARQAVARNVALPPGYAIAWSGQYEYMLRARERLIVVIPLVLVVIVVLLYAATHSWLRVGIVLLAVPFSLVGAIWFMYWLGYNLSLAAWVGIIALAGLDAETGLIMLLYLDNSYMRYRQAGRLRTHADLWHAVHDGAVRRIRPKTMTVATTFVGLLPLMWASGAGADTMRRLAAPMIGGLVSSFVLELLIYPVLYFMARSVAMRRQAA